jgi:hypothetical protein
MRDVTQARLRLWQLSMALLLAGLLLAISLMVLYLNAQARAVRRGAFNCGALDQATIDSTEPGDIIMIMQPETGSGGPVTISRELIIQGGWLPKVSFDCEGDNIPETFETITDALVHFEYTPGARSNLPAANPPGPIISISPGLTSTVTLQQLEFDDNDIVDQSGAGVSGTISNGARVKLDQVLFADNTANPGNGAGVDFTLSGGRLDISTAEFNQNFAQDDGGGARLILQNGSTVMITEAIFSDFNEAERGAGLYAEVRGGSHLILSEVEFTEGNATQTGGGFEIHVFDNSQVSLDKVEVLNNNANNGNGGGGRIVIHSGFVTVMNSSFSGNEADGGRGGGLAVEGVGSGPSFALLKNNVITGNTATLSHPDLYINGTVTILTRQLYLPVVRKKSS